MKACKCLNNIVLSAVLAAGALFYVSLPAYAQTPNLLTDMPGIEPGAPILVQADEMIYNNETDEVVAIGNVQIFYDQYVLVADKVIYDRIADKMTAFGNVRFTQPDGNVVFAETFTVTGDFKEGFIQSVSLLTPENARVVAKSGERIDGNIIIFNHAIYTACAVREEDPEEAPIWQIRAVRVVHNQEKQIIEYESATFEFLGVPIAHFPYFFHPDPTVKRKSGFLVPSAGYSSELGASVSLPYFWVVAPNADITLTPTVFTEQGLMMEGEWRHRTANGAYSISGGGIFQLDKDEFLAPGNTDARSYLRSWGHFDLSPQWVFGWDGTIVSDDTFMDIYGINSQNEIVSESYLVGQSDRNYFDARVMHFRNLVLAGDEEMQPLIHPVVDYNVIFDHSVFGGQLSLDSNVTSLTRELGPKSSRASADLQWSRTFTDRFGQQFTPFFSLRGDVFYLDNVPDPITAMARPNETLARGMVTAGLEYRYPFISVHSWGQQIIEPIVQIMVRPDEQDAGIISNEDAMSLVFDDTILFSQDKFSGFDRVEGGTRANVGFRYTLQSNSGARARVVAGQSFQIAGANPFGVGTGLDSSRSDFVGGVYVRPNEHFGFYSQFRVDSEDYILNRQEVGGWFNYRGAKGRATYMQVRDETSVGTDLEEILGAALMPISASWHLLGSYRYDLVTPRTVSRSIGIGYICDCFNASFEVKESFSTNRDIQPDLTFLFRFFFKSLGGSQIGSSEFDQFDSQ